MEKCLKHNKGFAGGCMWCSKRLCELCIARKEGIKLYCEVCAQRLGPVRRTIPHIEPAKPQRSSLAQKPVISAVRHNPLLDSEGYIDLTKVRR